MSFVPQPFWSLSVQLSIEGSPIQLVSERGRMFDKKRAEGLVNSLKKWTEAKVVDVSSEKKSSSRPHALNTVEMLKAASSGLGMSPQDTMHVAERLYITGYISYPRTETSKYP